MERPVKLIVRKDSQSTKNGDELSAGENVACPFRGDLGRRTFLAGAAALGASLLLSREGAAAQAAAATGPHRIDVHSHITPPSYSSDLGAKHLLSAPVLGWTLAKFIEEMDEGGVATSITSLAPPGVWTGDDAIARGIARSCNDYAARLVADHPGRFGMFGTLPIPDIEGTLHEIEYALDVLKADGVAMFTNSGDKWLGDPFYTPVFEELNRRKAVVFTHPRSATCCKNVLPGINDSNIEYGTDTTRAIVQIVANGVSTRFPDVRMIFPHAGGTMPFLSGRFVKLVQTPEFAQRLPQGFMAEAKKFYYDVAQSANPAAMAALLKVMPVSQIVFGTDYPFDNAAETAQGLKACGLFNSKDLRAIDRENALRLLPKYKT